MDSNWRRRAKCATTLVLEPEEAALFKDTEELRVANVRALHKLFFPSRGDNQSFRRAMDMCSDCPVKVPCLGYALRTSQKQGVWGHSSERTRRRIRRMRYRVFLSGDFLNPDYTEYKSEWASYWATDSNDESLDI
jgi:hypothetical protein